MPLFEIAAVIFLGLCFGSFATALSWRIPHGTSWIGSKNKNTTYEAARSRCPSCERQLRWLELVPVFSWLLQRGRCRYCRERIPLRYPLIEILVLAGILGVYALWGFTPAGVMVMLCIPFLAALLAIDIEHFILPDQLNVISAGIGVLYLVSFQNEDGWRNFLGTHIGGAFLFGVVAWLTGQGVRLVLKKEALGFGDVKFFAVAGLWLGASFLPIYLMLSGVFGVLFGLAWKTVKKDTLFPFGPALILSFYACFLAQKAGLSGVFGLY